MCKLLGRGVLVLQEKSGPGEWCTRIVLEGCNLLSKKQLH